MLLCRSTDCKVEPHESKLLTVDRGLYRWLDASFSGPGLVPKENEHKRIMEDVVKRNTPSLVSAGLDLLAGSTGRWAGLPCPTQHRLSC